MKNTFKGFTLLEVLIGISLVLTASVIFFKAMELFKKETVFYSEHFIAAAMIEKVLEQTYQESETNPHGLKALAIVDDQDQGQLTSSMITNGQNVFFQNPEITKENLPVLFELLNENFAIEISAAKKDGFHEVQTKLSWSAKYGSGNSMMTNRILSFTGEKEVESALILKEEKVEKLLLEKMFGDSGNLSSNISSEGALKLAKNIGKLYFTGFEVLSSEDFQKRCQLLEISFANILDQNNLEEVSEKHFAFARDLLHLMVVLEKDTEQVLADISFLDALPSREKGILQGYVLTSGIYMQQIRSLFLISLIKLIKLYEKQILAESMIRKRRELLLRIFNFYRILYVNRSYCVNIGKESVTEQQIKLQTQNFIASVNKQFYKNDRALARMAIQEKDFIDNNRMKAMYFVPGYIENIFKNIDKIANYRF